MELIQVFTVETEQGQVDVSMRSTGLGAWVAVKPRNPQPFKTKITPIQWVQDAGEVANMLEGGE